MKPDLLADVQGVGDDHLFDDAPQGVGARQYPAVAQQAAPPDDEHLFDDAPQGVNDDAAAADRAFGAFPQGVKFPTDDAAAADKAFSAFPQGMRDSSAPGAFARGAALGAAPAVGGLAGAGIGANAGFAAGEALFPAGGGLVGGVAGGLVGAFGGGAAIQKGQDWLISKLPQEWQDKLDEQQQSDTAQHPTAQFIGGLAPFALTMSPSVGAVALPENATALQRLMANPVTQRMFSGAVMGGTELGQEYASGESPDWAKVGISTGMGFFLPRPNALGEKILRFPAAGQSDEAKRATLADAGDMKVAGPGITEQVYQGQEEMAPPAEANAIRAAQADETVTDGPRTPDVHSVARQMHPELFAQYDDLVARRDEFRRWVDEANNPPQSRYDELQSQHDDLNAQLEGTKNQAEQRRLRAMIRDVGNQWAGLDERKAAFEAGEAQDTPELAAARQKLMDADYQLRDIGPEVAMAYRRAGEAIGGQSSSPESPPPQEGSRPVSEAPIESGSPPQQPPRTRDEQRQAIADDVQRQLQVIGVPQAQAESRALLEGAFFDTLAARGQGAFGTAEELYNRHGPIWKGRFGAPQETVEPALAQGASAKAAGGYTFRPDTRPIIELMRRSDSSTLIHEGGHNYLDILGAYANHPDAPSALKDDWQSILDWTKAHDLRDLQERRANNSLTPKEWSRFRSAHEKFARGFEQYMREGVAPSERLARVFSNFRQWLTAIYRTVKGLGKPINDDIRDVFDRMLAEQPRPTVLAPEASERLPTLADLHEQDAAQIEPHEAEAAMDRIIAERDQAIEDHQPNVRVEIESKRLAQQPGATAEPAAEGREGAIGAGRLGEDRGESESQPGSGARGEAGGAEQRGGGNAGAEGAGLAAGTESTVGTERAVHARESAGNALTPGPAPIWERPQSGLTDKAGNIVLRNVTPENFGQALIESAERNDDFRDIRGNMTKGQMWDLATELGLNLQDVSLESQLARIVGKFNDLAPVALALRRLTRESAKDVWNIASVAAKSQSDGDAAQLAASLSRHDMIQSALSGATASWGRTGSAFHNLRSFPEGVELDQALRQTTGRTLYQLKMMAKMLAGLEGKSEADQTAALSQFVKDSGQFSFGRMILEYWVNGLISGIPTHVTYSIGNTLSAATNVLIDTPTAAAIGALRKAAGRQGEVVPFGETAARLKGAKTGFAPAVTAALDATRTGVATTLPGQSPGMTPKIPGVSSFGAATLKEQATFVDAAHALYALGRGLKDGIVTGGAIATVGGPAFQREYSLRGSIPNFRVFGTQIPSGDIARLPGRMVAANHSFFTGLGYAIEMNGLEYRQAWNEGNRGDKLAERITQLRLNRTPEMMEQASKTALEGALMGPGGAFTRWLSEGLNKPFNIPGLGEAPYLKFIDPFVHISANILNKAIVERTPVGLLSPSMREDLMGKNGAVAQDLASAKMMVGTTIALTFGWLAAEGYVTGGGPKDPRKQAVWQVNRILPHSVKLGDQWVQLNRLGPLGMLVGMAADLYEASASASQGDLAAATGALVHGVAQNVLDESFMRGPADLLKAVDDPNYAKVYLKNQAATFLPASVEMGYLTRSMDPYSRQARTLIDGLRAKMPFDVGFGKSTDLFPRRDLWGMPNPNLRSVDQLGLTAIWASKQSKDPVNQELLRLGIAPSPVERRIRGQTLSDAQYDEYARIAGGLTKSNLDTFIRSPQWFQIPDASKRDIIEHAFKANREGAANIVMARQPEIMANATARKTAHASGQDIRPIQ